MSDRYATVHTLVTGIVLGAIGAIVAYAITVHNKDVNVHRIGVILLIVGVAVFAVGVAAVVVSAVREDDGALSRSSSDRS